MIKLFDSEKQRLWNDLSTKMTDRQTDRDKDWDEEAAWVRARGGGYETSENTLGKFRQRTTSLANECAKEL